jgi:hypothetical protein
MYFVWQSNAALSKKYMYVRKAPNELRPKGWTTGKALVKEPTIVTLTGSETSPTTLSDVILGGFHIPVLSPQAVSVLQDAGVDNIQYFPINIRNWETGELNQSYKIANIIGLVNCLDRKHATVTTFPEDKNEISWLQEYRIFEDRIAPRGGGKKAPLVFRLGEFRDHVLAHESVKTAFEKAGITGSKFEPPETFA